MTNANFGQIQNGWDVYANDGQHIGSVGDVTQDYIVVKKGLLLTKDYYVPADGIMQVKPDQGQVFLNCTKEQIDSMGWDQTPAAGSYSSAGQSTERMNQTSDYRGAEQTQRLPRYEEELRADKASEQTGEVSVAKKVTQDEQAFDVPVTREDVEVRRTAVNRPAGQTEDAFQEGDTIRVPVREEQVHVSKEPRVVEEIELRKTPRQETKRVSDTVRREEFDVNQSGDVDVRDRGGELVGAGADRTQRTELDDEMAQGSHPVDIDTSSEDETDQTNF